MNPANLLVFVVGSIWCAAGVTVVSARRKGCSIPWFYFLGSLWAAAILGLYMLCSGEAAQLRIAQWPLVAMISGGAVVNGIGQAVIMWNLKSGGCALVYAIPQLGFILPFLASGLFWGERITWLNLLGVIVEAVAILSVFPRGSRDPDDSREAKRILVALGALLLLGTSQLFYLYPSLPRNAELKLPASASAFFTLAANMVSFLVITLAVKKKEAVPWKFQLPLSLLWGTVAATAFFVLYITFQLMAEQGMAGLVYPVASSTEIVLFTLFTRIRFRERLSLRRSLALAAIVVGIFMIQLRF